MYLPKITLQSLITDAVQAFNEEFGGRPELLARGNHLSFIAEHMTRVAEAMAKETKLDFYENQAGDSVKVVLGSSVTFRPSASNL